MNRFARMCAFLCLLAPALVTAQPSKEIELTREVIQAEKKLLIARNMNLTEEEGKRFWPLYEAHQKGIRDLNNRLLGLIEKFAENYDSLTDEVAAQLVDESLNIRQDRLRLTRAYVARFREILSERQVARYFQIERKLESVIDGELARAIPLVR